MNEAEHLSRGRRSEHRSRDPGRIGRDQDTAVLQSYFATAGSDDGEVVDLLLTLHVQQIGNVKRIEDVNSVGEEEDSSEKLSFFKTDGGTA